MPKYFNDDNSNLCKPMKQLSEKLVAIIQAPSRLLLTIRLIIEGNWAIGEHVNTCIYVHKCIICVYV